MLRATRSLLLLSIPALAAGWLVLAIAGVGPGLWAVQAAATVLMLVIAAAGRGMRGRANADAVLLGTLILAVVACGLARVGSAAHPARWLSLGSFRLYAAPVVVPPALLAYGLWTRRNTQRIGLPSGLMVGLAALLAAQPDAAQVLALTLAMATALNPAQPGASAPSQRMRLGLMALLLGACGAAFLQPDPLQPVPYVEGVFRLALGHSWLVGLTVLLGAVAFVGLLFARLRAFGPGLGAVAVYYAALFAGSALGLTPAPLIGFGAGPLLGYGLTVAILAQTEPLPAMLTS